ncbi:PQQ-binding-like beta-propeller repeat protein [Streptomyces turgidiscabies]|uniref:PQQ enzyme repeat protein n=1 Tax=Streptomyces turgidiscabies (strain Car8) TaxID=698760 RepID=L7EVL4_STRT8|nr:MULTISPECIES: PQQ-binding-like beta-propeller repeat protein [Streptomyces]ELP62430.1 PQQ enzyme repeat protein [Streptomyces turgidiscabies Car8]MDX3492646.1 PQQ-binding-like beta-propeller repeat protein [Streptomyces turgidiscabies]
MHQDRAPESVWEAAPEPAKRRLRLFRRDPEAQTLWQSEFEQQDLGEPLGLWATDQAVALARFDHVTAYAPATGEPLWSWQPPGQDVIVRVTEDAEDGLGVVLHHDDGDAHAQHVRLTALDLGSGAVAWSREQPKDRLGYVGADHARDVAIGGGRIATVRGGKAGAPPFVRCLDARTGAVQWERSLPDHWGGSFSVLATDPPVLSVRNRGKRSRPRLYVVREDGEWYVELPAGYKDFGPVVAVVGDTLAVGLEPDDPADDEKSADTVLRAYSVPTGEQLWEWRTDHGRTLHPLAHRGYLMVGNGYGSRVTVLDPTDGRVVAERRLPGFSYRARYAAWDDRLAVVCHAVSETRRVRVFRWK